MFRQHPSKPEDLICRLLSDHGYENVEAFRNASVRFNLVIDPEMAKVVEMDSSNISKSVKEFDHQFKAAEAFLSTKKEGFEGRDKVGYEHAVKSLAIVIAKHDQTNVFGPK